MKDIRAPLRGLLLESDGQTVNAVATDGHRLACASIENDECGEFSAIIPRKAIHEIVRLLHDEQDELLKLGINQHFVSFQLARMEQLTFASKLIVGQFPAFREVIPKSNLNSLRVNREEFLLAVKQATLINPEQGCSVRVDLETTQCKISCSNADGESSEVVIPSEFDGEAMPVAFNASYLQNALSSCSLDMVTLSLSGANVGVLIEEQGDDGMLQKHVIMPLTL